jgi:hypothetical protein
MLSLKEWIFPYVLELIYTAWDLEPFSQDCGWSGPPFRWDEQRRFFLRCELDAAFFHLYLPAEVNGDWCPAENETAEDLAQLKGSYPTPRDAVAYIMETFPIVKRKDAEQFGEYRTKRVILKIYDAMQDSIRTGQPYQTRLDPPPADPRCCHPRLKIGILAFGSLINDPGSELEPKITMRINTTTPFAVEYARISGETRGGAPTLVPHENCSPVSAQILILDDASSIDEAKDMLWRRETGKIGTGEKYSGGRLPNSVLVPAVTDSPYVEMLLYTDFHDEAKIPNPNPQELAKLAIESVKKAKDGMDGITYLVNAITSGVKTQLTEDYKAEILRQTNTQSLEDALIVARQSE